MTETISKNALIAKARGFTISIQKMDEKQRANSPSAEYGEGYNKLRNLVQQQHSGLSDVLPPPVQFYKGGVRVHTLQRYSEIDTFCEQIVQLLSS